MPTADAELLDRCLDFEIAVERDVSEVVAEHDWGCAYLSPGLDKVWDANWLLVDRADLSPDEIEAIADGVLGGAGMAHRTVMLRRHDESEARAAGLEALGYERERGVYMVWTAEPDRPAGVEVEEVRQDDVHDLRRQLIKGDLAAEGQMGSGVVDQLLEWDRRLGAVAGDRWFAARDGNGGLASCCRLLARDGIGQVEDVGTLRGARQRGLARSVTLAAAEASRADGNELTYLGALADDWPRLMYAKLGFEPMGINWIFRRKPPNPE